MTLTNSQYIQVVELWGWTLIDGDWYQPTPNPDWPQGLKVCTETGIKSEVNSWSGFGRTVEAIRASKHFAAKDRLMRMYEGYLQRGITKEMLWERTHLAALEAIDAEGS